MKNNNFVIIFDELSNAVFVISISQLSPEI